LRIMKRKEVLSTNKKTKKVLQRLREGEIDFKEAVKVLNITEEEVWNLLDDFDYFPSGKILRSACQIERNSLRKLEEKFVESPRRTSEELKEDIIRRFPVIPSDRSRKWIDIEIMSSESSASAMTPKRPIPLLPEEKGKKIYHLAGTSSTANLNSSLLQRS
jgi:hypothetical protein